MVVSGNDHLNDSNYCNCAAIEHYSRFQIDNGTNGVLWVWYVRAVWGQNYRVRILHKKKKHCQSSQLLLFLLLHLLFLSSPSWPVSPPPSSSSISSSTYTPHGSPQFFHHMNAIWNIPLMVIRIFHWNCFFVLFFHHQVTLRLDH